MRIKIVGEGRGSASRAGTWAHRGVYLALICALLCRSIPALAQTSFLSLSPGTGGPGNFAVAFYGGGGAPAGLQWTLAYSSGQISSVRATAGPAATAATKTLSCASVPGVLTCLLTGSNANGIGAGVVANIQLTLAANVTAPSLAIFKTVGVSAAGSSVHVTGIFVSQPLTVPGGVLSGPLAGTPYTQALFAAGGDPPYIWSLAGGSVPSGMSLQSTETLAGTPNKSGLYTFTARVTDQTGASAVGTFSINVAAPPVTITTPSPLASGMVTVDYPVQVLSASGGAGPYTYTVPQNTLPPGITLSSHGAIYGTPTAAGNFAFTITVTDSNSQTSSASFQITVKPFSTDLATSVGSLSFSLAAGATALPATQTVRVRSTDVTKILAWSTAITPASSWLSVSPGGTTPGFFSVAMTSTALSLAASATPYQAAIVVSCMAPSPCAGNSQTIAVSLIVSAAPPELTVLTNLLSFTTSSTNPQPITQSVILENTGGGTIGLASVVCVPAWCVVNSMPASIGSSVQTIDITADPTGLDPGYYYTDLTIDTSVGPAVVPITFFIAANPNLTLNPPGVRLIMPVGGGAAPDTSFLVSTSGTAPVTWTATELPGAPWLNLSTSSGTSTSTVPGAIGYSINQTVAAALLPRIYYGTIRVTASGAANSPQDFEVILDITAATAPPTPHSSPAGLIFLTSTGDELSSAGPPPQNVQLFANSVTAVPYQASAATVGGNPWLSVTPATGSTSASSVAQTTVTVSPAGLAPGVYRGSVSYSLSAAAMSSVNVTLVVEATGQTCTPTQIVPTQTALVTNFAAQASMPTPLEIRVIDDCGSPVTNGQVVATFSNGDPPLTLNLENASSGLYSGTWTPRNTGAQVTVTASSAVPGFATATTRISGAVVPNSDSTIVPLLAPNGILHIFTPQAGAPLAPGTVVQIYGSSLAAQTISAASLPLTTILGDTSVTIGGLPAPLFFVSPGQVNAQIPFELTPGQPYQVIVNNNGALSTPEEIEVTSVTPGMALLPSGYAIAQHSTDGSTITDAAPAAPGEYIVVYLAGMGPTGIPVPSGAAAPSNPLAQTVNPPSIMLDSELVPFLYSGLTPGLAGLYQINLQVPADAHDGVLELVVSQAGFQGPAALLPVHH